jgi:hypothetical protein
MSEMDIDLEMLLILPFSWGAAVSLGLVGDEIIPFISASEVLFTAGNASITVGRIVSILALGAVFYNRDASITDTSGIDAWIVYATVGLLVAPPLFPAFQETLASGIAGLIAFTVQSTGFLLVSYIN